MRTNEELDELSKKAAYLIMRAMKMFESEPVAVRDRAQQIIMQRVQRMMNGEQVNIEGPDLVREIQDPGPTTP